MRTRRIALIAATVRVLQALLTQTFFQPDEYFQSLEVAHRAVFGYGQLTWEWSIDKPIRSILFPSIWIPLYWILHVTGLHNTGALIWAPKIISGLLASITDVAVCRVSRQLFGSNAVPVTLLLTLLSFFHALSLVRSMSNSLETSLTILALSYWPLDPRTEVSIETLFLPVGVAALSCAIRPTNAVIWVYLCCQLLIYNTPNSLSGVSLVNFILVVGCTWGLLTLGGLVLLLQFLVDSLYFGTCTLTPLNFLKVNLSPIALFYGGNAWHYYLTQAIPVLLANQIPLFLHGVYLALSDRHIRPKLRPVLRNLLGLTVWTVSIYSLAEHKEWRFIHPVLPIMHVFCTFSLITLTPKTGTSSPAILAKPAGFLVFLSLPVILYTTFIHGRAQIAAMHYLRSLPSQELRSVGFLMPCHSTPWMAYLHRPHLDGGFAWALGCEPPLRVTNSSQYLDQTGAFYTSPIDYFRDYFPASVDTSFPISPQPTSDPGRSDLLPVRTDTRYAQFGFFFVDDWKYSWPEQLVMFGVLPKAASRNSADTVGSFLERKGYSRTWRTFNGFEEDDKRRGGVEVWSWRGHDRS